MQLNQYKKLCVDRADGIEVGKVNALCAWTENIIENIPSLLCNRDK